MFSLYYQNVQGLRSKTNDVYRNVHNSNYQAIALTETWLQSHISTSEVMDDRYMVCRRDRSCTLTSKKDGGGVLLAITRDIPSVRLTNLESDDIESVWVKLQLPTAGSIQGLTICVVYLPPPVKLGTLKKFLNQVEFAMNHADDVLVVGDLNLGFIEWNTNRDCVSNSMIPSNYNSNLGYALVDFLSSNNLYQYNNISNNEKRFLDLVISNMPNLAVKEPLDRLVNVIQYILVLC
jgi:exonuclease III